MVTATSGSMFGGTSVNYSSYLCQCLGFDQNKTQRNIVRPEDIPLDHPLRNHPFVRSVRAGRGLQPEESDSIPRRIEIGQEVEVIRKKFGLNYRVGGIL